MSAPTIQLTGQQGEAAEKIHAWYADKTEQVFRLFGYAGTGKAERNGSQVQTPNGPVNIEDLAVGDLVFGADGWPIPVTGVFPQGVRDTYQVTFRDGVSVYCDRDHLWNVQTAKTRQTGRPYKTMTTGEILESGVRFACGIYRYSIPLCEPAQYPELYLPVDPYVLGALIGDGTNLGSTPTLCIPARDRFIADEVKRRLPDWAVMTLGHTEHCDYHRITDPRVYRANETAAHLGGLGLAVTSPQRFIPADYLHASVAQRWDLLRGLMDTDGCARDNRITFSTKSASLAADVATLVQSLGGVAIYQHTSRDDEYCINVKLMTCPFLLPRKAQQWRPSTKNPPSRRIVSIEPAGRAEHTCISVAATDGLYLTDHYVLTHNSTVAIHLVNSLDVTNVIYAAFTGKAAYVLRTKGCFGACTIHSLIYLPAEKARARLRELTEQLDAETDLTKRDLLQRQIKIEERKLESPDWIMREPDDTDLAGADLLVIDEVSMVGDKMAADLLSYNVPTLVLGDPAQLPPVDGAGYFIDASADHLLTEIHRSALDSPVTRLATAVRGAQLGDRAYAIPDPDGESGRVEHITVGDLLAADQVLVGTNNTRWQAIHLLRALRGQVGDLPVPGDRIMILANSGTAEVFNGQQFDVRESIVNPKRADRILLDLVDDEDNERELTAWRAGFAGIEGEKQAKRDGRGSIVGATFGQAITVHKSQGSQWDRVLIVDESHVFAGIEAKNTAKLRRNAGLADGGHSAQAGHVAGQRWLYTAITRAAQRVTILPRLTGVIR